MPKKGTPEYDAWIAKYLNSRKSESEYLCVVPSNEHNLVRTGDTFTCISCGISGIFGNDKNILRTKIYVQSCLS